MKLYMLLFLFGATMSVSAAEFQIGNEEEFRKLVAPEAKVQKLAGGFKFTEGPVWLDRDGGYLIFSDIPSNELKKWTKAAGIATFRVPSHNANGNTRDLQGRLVTCEHGSRTVTRTEMDGTIITLADRYDGKLLNSPNDAVVKSDGSIWFTDPPYGLGKRDKEQAGNYVFRLDPATKKLTIVAADFDMPNGLCFSPDEKKLYIADSGKPRHIRVMEVRDDGTLAGGSVFCAIDKGVPDGIRCDSSGRVWSSAGDGVHIFAPDGRLIGKIFTPEVADAAGKTRRESCANLCFGGPDGKTLFMTAQTSLYSIQLK